MFAWALRCATWSVLLLFEHGDIEDYIATIRTVYFPSELATTWFQPVHLLKTIASVSQTDPASSSEFRATASTWNSWNGELMVRLLHASLDIERVQFTRSLHDYLVIEFSEWFGQDFWNRLILDTIACAVRNNDKVIFECVYEGYLETSQVPRKNRRESHRDLAAVPQFTIDALTENTVITITWLYHSTERLFALRDLPRFNKDHQFRQVLIVAALLSKADLSVVKRIAGTSASTSVFNVSYERKGPLTRMTPFMRVLRQVNVWELVQIMTKVERCLLRKVDSAIEAFSNENLAMISGGHLGDVTIEVFEASARHLLQYSGSDGEEGGLYEVDLKSLKVQRLFPDPQQ